MHGDNPNRPTNTKILITGGAGFIGSALVRHLINHTDYSVVNVDKLTYAGNLAALKTVSDNPRYSFEQVDICDIEALKRVFEQYQPGQVFHLAAESHVDRSIASPADFIQTNIVGTFNLLEQTRTYLAEHPQKQNSFRFIHVSTDEVYGDLNNATVIPSQGGGSFSCEQDSGLRADFVASASPQNDNFILSAFTETSPYKPSSPYSASKAASDHLIQAWFRTYQLPGILVHCSNNYGPYQYIEKLIPKTILNALSGQAIPIYGDGQQIRDWLYVEDTVRALMTIAAKGQVGEIYNVGGNTEKTNIEVVNTICEILDELAPRYPKHTLCHPEQSDGSLTHSTVTQREIEGPPSLQCTTLKDSSPSVQNDRDSWHPEQSEGSLTHSTVTQREVEETKSARSGTKPESPNHGCTTLQDSSALPQNDTPSCHPEQSEGSPSRLCTTSKDSSPSVQNDSYKYFITFVKDRPGHDQRYAINTSKIQTQLGWAPHENFESGIRKTVQSYLDHQAWWSKCNRDY